MKEQSPCVLRERKDHSVSEILTGRLVQVLLPSSASDIENDLE